MGSGNKFEEIDKSTIFKLIADKFTLKDGRLSPQAGKQLLKKYPAEYQFVIDQTSFLAESCSMSVRLHCIKNNITEHPRCSVCNNLVKYIPSSGQFAQTCSVRCMTQSDVVKRKRSVTNLARYGSIAPANGLKEKSVETLMRNYGVISPLKSNIIQDKRRDTLIDKYGTSNINLVDSIVEKRKNTNLRKYDDISSSRRHWTDNIKTSLNDKQWLIEQHHVNQRPLLAIARDLNISDKILGDYYKKHGVEIKSFQFSTGEQEAADFITSLGVDALRNIRTIIPPKELDIFIPSHNIAIEFCGLYWHGENQGKHRQYHREKYLACKEKNIQLITMYDWEWQHRQEQIKSKLKTLLNLNTESTYARKCTIRDVNKRDKSQFFNQYHVQGAGPGSITHGLYHNDQLVAAMTWIVTKTECMLNRYATSVRVVGGFTKLLAHFQRTHDWKRIVSFADLRWSDGSLYERAGFTLESELPPDYAYIVGNQPMHKFAFRHKSLSTKLPNYEPTLSEWENMKAHGYDRIWDCGKLRYVLLNV